MQYYNTVSGINESYFSLRCILSKKSMRVYRLVASYAWCYMRIRQLEKLAPEGVLPTYQGN